MSVGLRAVQWNRDKLVYDAILLVCVVVFMAVFVNIHQRLHPPKNVLDEIDIWIRATGTCAFVMLTVILCIGPLARLDRRFLPLLYNRRHFGVMTFIARRSRKQTGPASPAPRIPPGHRHRRRSLPGPERSSSVLRAAAP